MGEPAAHEAWHSKSEAFSFPKVRAEMVRRLGQSNGRRACGSVLARTAYRGDESLHLGFKRSELIAEFVTRR
jgi:hypothetical protein